MKSRAVRHKIKPERGMCVMFALGFIQVMLVSINTWNVANHRLVSCVLIGIAISIVWSINVRGVVFGSWWHRILYALGGGLGTATGAFLAPVLNRFFQ